MDTRPSNPLISIIIPNFNGAGTLRQCLSAAMAVKDENYEIIVVDDGSHDNSVGIIKEFPCRLIQLEKQSGASRARNVGAEHSHGDILFFTDADCLIQADNLCVIRQTMAANGPNVVVGGTYTVQPGDNRFFSAFQSAFIHFSETKHLKSPDYLASHALAIDANTFRQSEGFAQDFLPILEDVEFSHRLRKMGRELIVEPRFLVQHVFNYSLMDSFRNAMRKTKYWVAYSLNNRDLLSDSGTASHELKMNVLCFYISLLSLYMLLGLDMSAAIFGLAVITMLNITVNRKLFWAFYDANGSLFTLRASLYYLLAYPIPVGAGAVAGVAYFIKTKTKD